MKMLSRDVDLARKPIGRMPRVGAILSLWLVIIVFLSPFFPTPGSGSDYRSQWVPSAIRLAGCVMLLGYAVCKYCPKRGRPNVGILVIVLLYVIVIGYSAFELYEAFSLFHHLGG